MAGGRDDLSIDAHGLRGQRVMLESADASTLIEDWIDESSNLPLELKRMQDEIAERRQQIEDLCKTINQRDTSIQRWIQKNGSHVPNPKEADYRKVIVECQKKVSQLLDENVKQGMETKKLLDKRILALDKGIKKLIDRGELQEDPEMPSLLRPEIPASQPTDRSTDLMNSSFLPTSGAPPSNSFRGIGRSATGLSSGPRATPQQNAAGQQGQGAVPAISAIPAAVAAQRARESSAGASNKRQRIAGSLSIPPVSGSLARQSSLGPGTPKGSNLGPSSRSGSAGPRPLKSGSAATKKTGPPGKSNKKSRLGKSSISRVKRTHGGGSPSSNNDSEHSDGESGSQDDDEPGTPPADQRMFDGEEEDNDDKKYCICQSTSFGDMVACDNANCPFEWFHWTCMGITSDPEGDWYCGQPECNKTRRM